MAIVREKSTRRHRLQFTLDRCLHEKYRELVASARALGVEIDFSEDFALWFADQLEELRTKLSSTAAKNAKKGSPYDKD